MCARAILTAFSIASAPVVNRIALCVSASPTSAAEPRRQLDVRLVHRHLKAGVHQAIELLVHGADDVRVAMAGVEDADAAREVQVLLAVDVPDARAFGALDEDRVGVGEAARHVALARADRRVGIRLDDRHRSASVCIVLPQRLDVRALGRSAPIDTRTIQRPSSTAGVR